MYVACQRGLLYCVEVHVLALPEDNTFTAILSRALNLNMPKGAYLCLWIGVFVI
jgi:hypothetical protein